MLLSPVGGSWQKSMLSPQPSTIYMHIYIYIRLYIYIYIHSRLVCIAVSYSYSLYSLLYPVDNRDKTNDFLLEGYCLNQKWIPTNRSTNSCGTSKPSKAFISNMIHLGYFDLRCATHRPVMGCICVTYEASQSIMHGAIECAQQTSWKTYVTLIFDLLTLRFIGTQWIALVP